MNRYKAKRQDDWGDQAQGINWPAVGAIVALHLFGLFLLLRVATVHETSVQSAPILVRLIAAAPAGKPEPQAALKPIPPPVSRSILTLPPLTMPAVKLSDSSPPAPSAASSAPSQSSPVSPPTFAAYLDNPAPDYPPMSRHSGESGRVVLRVLVSAEGHAQEVEVAHSSGFERLDHAAADAVHRWRFLPAKQGAEAVAAWVLVPITFDLNS